MVDATAEVMMLPRFTSRGLPQSLLDLYFSICFALHAAYLYL